MERWRDGERRGGEMQGGEMRDVERRDGKRRDGGERDEEMRWREGRGMGLASCCNFSFQEVVVLQAISHKRSVSLDLMHAPNTV